MTNSVLEQTGQERESTHNPTRSRAFATRTHLHIALIRRVCSRQNFREKKIIECCCARRRRSLSTYLSRRRSLSTYLSHSHSLSLHLSLSSLALSCLSLKFFHCDHGHTLTLSMFHLEQKATAGCREMHSRSTSSDTRGVVILLVTLLILLVRYSEKSSMKYTEPKQPFQQEIQQS